MPLKDAGEWRSLLAKGSSEEVFAKLCEKLGTKEPSEETLSYLVDHVSRWPREVVRTAPLEWVDTLRDGTSLPQLKLINHLKVHDSHIEQQEWFSMFNGSTFGELVYINLDHCRLGGKTLQHILDDPSTHTLESLNLASNLLDAQAVKMILGAKCAPMLKQLNLGFNPIGTQGAAYLAQNATLTQMKYLLLYTEDVGEQGTRELANASSLPYPLRSLWQERARQFSGETS